MILDQLVLEVGLETQETLEILDQLGTQDLMVPVEIQVHRDQLVIQEVMVNLENKARLVLLDQLGLEVQLDLLDHKDPLGTQDQLDHQEPQAEMVNKASGYHTFLEPSRLGILQPWYICR